MYRTLERNWKTSDPAVQPSKRNLAPSAPETRSRYGQTPTSAQRFPKKEGLVVWLTGLSGAGKSTIAFAAAGSLAQQGVRTEVLDGDLLRQSLSRDLGFSKADRDEHVARVGFVANVLSRFGAVVFVALVSPYEEARKLVRARVPNFVEV